MVTNIVSGDSDETFLNHHFSPHTFSFFNQPTREIFPEDFDLIPMASERQNFSVVIPPPDIVEKYSLIDKQEPSSFDIPPSDPVQLPTLISDFYQLPYHPPITSPPHTTTHHIQTYAPLTTSATIKTTTKATVTTTPTAVATTTTSKTTTVPGIITKPTEPPTNVTIPERKQVLTPDHSNSIFDYSNKTSERKCQPQVNSIR